MLKAVYHGSEAALRAGLEEINTAALALGGEELVQRINASGLLADAETHFAYLATARNLNKQRKGG